MEGMMEDAMKAAPQLHIARHSFWKGKVKSRGFYIAFFLLYLGTVSILELLYRLLETLPLFQSNVTNIVDMLIIYS